MIYISLGANVPSRVGSPDVTLRAALEELKARGVRVLKVSSLYLTPAWPNESDPPFVNAIAEVGTNLGPNAFLKLLLSVEKSFGRVRKVKWEPRCLDLDIVDFGGLITDEIELSLPHPRLQDRAFVLWPLFEICPDWRHPDTGATIPELLEIVGEGGVQRL